jgi:acetyl-CoA synthetase
MPNCPETVFAMLACARIGAVHTAVFAGFSSEALAARISDAHARVVLTADLFYRGGKAIYLKQLVDEAVSKVSFVEHVVVLRRSTNPADPNVPWHSTRDLSMRELMVRTHMCCRTTIASLHPS